MHRAGEGDRALDFGRERADQNHVLVRQDLADLAETDLDIALGDFLEAVGPAVAQLQFRLELFVDADLGKHLGDVNAALAPFGRIGVHDRLRGQHRRLE